MKKVLAVFLMVALLVCPVLAAGVYDGQFNLTTGAVAISKAGTYLVSGSSTTNGIKVSATGDVKIMLSGDVNAASLDCGSANVVITSSDGTGSLTVTTVKGEPTLADCYYNGVHYGHFYEVTVTTEATCTENGLMTYTCAGCGDTYSVAIPATGHNYVAVVTDPTCTEQGYTTYTCSKCGDSYVDDKTDALGHNYVAATVTPATCMEQGYTTYTCTRCGDSYQDDVTEALGHDYVYQYDAVYTYDETGAANGYESFGTWVCSRCGDTVDATEANAIYYMPLSAAPAQTAVASSTDATAAAATTTASTGPQISASTWTLIELISVAVIVVEAVILMASFEKKKTGSAAH